MYPNAHTNPYARCPRSPARGSGHHTDTETCATMNMAHPNMRVTFATLRDVCFRKLNLQVSMNLFDCGHHVRVIRDGATLIQGDWRCSDDPNAQDGPSKCAQWLVANGYLRVADFDAS